MTALQKSFKAPELRVKEIKRYLGGEGAIDTEDILALYDEVKDRIVYKACFTELDLKTEGDVCDFGLFSVFSKALSKNLSKCDKVLLFAVTAGVELDRIITKYSKISPSKAIVLQALGAERVESLCDVFLKEYEEEKGVKLSPRFSTGYGDLQLEVQRDIFRVLSLEKNIGISLTDGLLMTPSKSVTAFAGIKRK